MDINAFADRLAQVRAEAIEASGLGAAGDALREAARFVAARRS